MQAASNQARLTIFKFVTEENAETYRAIAQISAAQKHNFRLYLRPADIAQDLASRGSPLPEAALPSCKERIEGKPTSGA